GELLGEAASAAPGASTRQAAATPAAMTIFGILFSPVKTPAEWKDADAGRSSPCTAFVRSPLFPRRPHLREVAPAGHERVAKIARREHMKNHPGAWLRGGFRFRDSAGHAAVAGL